MKILILEDSKNRIQTFKDSLEERHELVITENAQEAIEILKGCDKFDYIFLDHDLGGEIFVDPHREDSGSAVVRYLQTMSSYQGGRSETVFRLWRHGQSRMIVHSMNIIQAINMENDLKDSGYQTYRIPFNVLQGYLTNCPEFLD